MRDTTLALGCAHWKGPSSPFTRLVEEIPGMKDRDLQLSFLRVVWLEKLLA
jgi:hypothetical protein